MNTRPTNNVTVFYTELLSAAKSFTWRSSTDDGIHHRNDYCNPNPEKDWSADSEETIRVESPSGTIFHLQIRLEHRGKSTQQHVLIFGRRLKTMDQKVPNTQRATFNSDHVNESGFWLRPTHKPAMVPALTQRLPGPTFPHWDAGRIHLGMASPYIIFRRFLIALSVIEDVKSGGEILPLPFEPDAVVAKNEFDAGDLDLLRLVQEGARLKVTTTIRRRCQRLLGEAQEFFRQGSADGRLHCQVCNWVVPVQTRAEIIQVHHLKQLRDYPSQGRQLTLQQALANLAPLCPNCHRLLESHPDGGNYSIPGLRKDLRNAGASVKSSLANRQS